MARHFLIAALAVSLCLLAVPTDARLPVNSRKDLQETLTCLAQSGKFSTFLKLLHDSGFEAILAQYTQKAPVTFFAWDNLAVKKLPQKIRRKLRGANLIKVLEYSMLQEIYPSKFIENTLDTAVFETVLGQPVVRAKAASKKTLAFKPGKAASAKDVFIITKGDACPAKRTVAVHIVSAVPIPRGLFDGVSST